MKIANSQKISASNLRQSQSSCLNDGESKKNSKIPFSKYVSLENSKKTFPNESKTAMPRIVRMQQAHSPSREKPKGIKETIVSVLTSSGKKETCKINTIDEIKKLSDLESWDYDIETCLNATFLETFFQPYLPRLQAKGTPDCFTKILEEISQQILDNVIQKNGILEDKIFYLKELLASHHSERLEGLDKLCSAQTIQEFLRFYNEIPAGENKELIVASFGGSKKIEKIQEWLNRARLRVLAQFQKIDTPKLLGNQDCYSMGTKHPLTEEEFLPKLCEVEIKEIEELVLPIRQRRTRRSSFKKDNKVNIEPLKNLDTSCWEKNLEKAITGALTRQVFQVHKTELSLKTDVQSFVQIIESITQEITKEIIEKNILLEAPIYFLNHFLKAHHLREDAPEGLRGLCLATSSPKAFVKAFHKILENNRTNKELILWTIGGQEILDTIQLWAQDKQMDLLRVKVLNFYKSIFLLKQNCEQNLLPFPHELPVPKLTNEMALRNWFPSHVCNVDELYINDQLVHFFTMPNPSKPFSEMDKAELQNNNACEKAIRRKNVAILIRAMTDKLTLFSESQTVKVKNIPQKNIDHLKKSFTESLEGYFNSLADDLINIQMAEEPCFYPELAYQSIQMALPITNILSSFFKKELDGFEYKKGSGKYICRYTKQDLVSITFEKQYDIIHSHINVGSFNLEWQYCITSPKMAKLLTCKMTQLQLGIDESSAMTHG